MGMPITQDALGFVQARAEFRRAHARARFRGLTSKLLRRCARLCSLVDAAADLGASKRGVQPSLSSTGRASLRDVPLERIVGSLGRATDYTDDFLPLISSDEERWARVRVAAESLEGLPPVELYDLDGDFYVKDGHHRVSVMKRMGLRRVEAYVTSLKVV